MITLIKKSTALIAHKIIEIDDNSIQIKSHDVQVSEITQLKDIQEIKVKDKYSLPQETMKEFFKEVFSKPKENFLIININNQEKRYDFVIDSYYMISELNNIIENWKSQGFNIQTIG
ncbi:MAG: hypothetical protein R2771_09685 [Saprospiraceae bacterium]